MFVLFDRNGRLVTGWAIGGLLIATMVSYYLGSDQTFAMMG
jgi:hypothetical protein